MKVHSANEWDKLKTVVVGSAERARFPTNDPVFATQAITTLWDKTPLPQGNMPSEVVNVAEYNLDLLVRELHKYDITTARAIPTDFSQEVSNSFWETDGMYNYCPRDLLLVIDNMVIEAPMTYRSRQHEVEGYDNIKRAAIKDGCLWLAAPKPALLDDDFEVVDGHLQLTEDYPIFDAANVCRLGKDLLYLKSETGNYRGGEWLQQVLPNHNVHIVDDLYSYAHIDSTIVPLKEGLVMLNGNRVNENNCPKILKDWDKIYIQDDEVVAQYYHKYPYASKWIGINLLVLEPGLVLMETGQPMIKKRLEEKNIEVEDVPMTMARTLGGGVHCTTLDLLRE